MGRIPTIIAEGSLPSGPTGPEASALAFSGGAGGLDALGQGLSNAGATLAQIALKQKRDDENRFVAKSSSQFLTDTSDFLENPENKQREDYATIAKEYLDKRKAEYLKPSPSRRATDMLTAHLDHYIASRYDSALRVGFENKITNTTADIQTSLNDTMEAYRKIADSGEANIAVDTIMPQRDQMLATINQAFGEKSKTALALRERVDRDFVLGIAERNPAAARELLKSSANVDEPSRYTLNREIDNFEESGNAQARVFVRDELEKRLSIGRTSNTMVDMPADAIFSVFGKAAPGVKSAYKESVDAHNGAIKLMADLRDKNADYQKQKLSEANLNSTGKATEDAVKQAAHAVLHAEQRQDTDPFGWQLENTLDVHQAVQRAESLPAEQRPQAMANAFDLALQRQGPAPAGATPEEAARYLNLPTHAWHLSSKAKVTDTVQQIMKGGPEEQVAALKQLQQTYTKKEHWAIAYNDLVTLPPEGQRLPQAIQLAFLIEDPGIQKEFVAAQTQAEGVKGLTEEKLALFHDKLDQNNLWKAFQKSMVGDIFGGAVSLDGYRKGILNYAHAESLKGMKAPDAVQTALQNVIGNHVGFTVVNGQTIAVPKYRQTDAFGPQLPVRTDEEIQDLGRRMALALRGLSTTDIQRTDNKGRPILPMAPPLPEGNVNLEQYWRDAITSKGYFVSEADGNSVTLYLMGDNGIGVQLRDKHNQPFELGLDALPKFSFMYLSPMQWKEVEMKEYPEKTYDISGFEPNPAGGFPDWVRKLTGEARRTNWPVTADYWFRQRIQEPPFKLSPHELRMQAIMP